MFHPDDIKRMAILATLAMLFALHANMTRAAPETRLETRSETRL